MDQPPGWIECALWSGPQSGLVRLRRDWTQKELPPLKWGEAREPLPNLQRRSRLIYAEESGYYGQGGWITFCLRADSQAQLEWTQKRVFVGGTFNGWGRAIGRTSWELEPALVRGRDYFMLTVTQKRISADGSPQAFKFVTGDGQWLQVHANAPNAVFDGDGNRNFELRPEQTGRHVFTFDTPKPLAEAHRGQLIWDDDEEPEATYLQPGEFLRQIRTDLPLGAHVTDGGTTFRVFAPRATAVSVLVYKDHEKQRPLHCLAMERADQGAWTISTNENYHGWYYHYSVESDVPDPQSTFDPKFKVLDPYALAAVGPGGPGIVLDRRSLPQPKERFDPPPWQDLVICEAHVRDLTAHAPISLKPSERLGFRGLAKWVRSEDFYLHQLGINAVELQPIQQFDAPTREEYHWGYMTTNFFAPTSHFASDPARATQIEEFADLVHAFHERGIAVLLDVVYNHVGEPNHLQYLDRHYYFELDTRGFFVNWSGTGNTLHADSPMARRLIIESLRYLVETFDVDGFRFDLAELLGVETLRAVEHALKPVKPSLVLIAEPWSFRGHIGHALKATGFASWNDGYREFLKSYVRGEGNRDGIEYFLAGSLSHLAAWPAQSVNYTESHDDTCWLDAITERDGHDGSNPTPTDRRRTHLMAAILFSSIGMPMISAGQDFLRSKKGHHNTYLRGDLNALDYRRLLRFSGTHEYFRSWIAFRLSPRGARLRLFERPEPGYLRFFRADGYSAVGLLLNGDDDPLFFAVNPHLETVQLPIDGLPWNQLTQIADHERFNPTGLPSAPFYQFDGVLELPPLSCGLWDATGKSI